MFVSPVNTGAPRQVCGLEIWQNRERYHGGHLVAVSSSPLFPPPSSLSLVTLLDFSHRFAYEKNDVMVLKKSFPDSPLCA